MFIQNKNLEKRARRVRSTQKGCPAPPTQNIKNAMEPQVRPARGQGRRLPAGELRGLPPRAARGDVGGGPRGRVHERLPPHVHADLRGQERVHFSHRGPAAGLRRLLARLPHRGGPDAGDGADRSAGGGEEGLGRRHRRGEGAPRGAAARGGDGGLRGQALHAAALRVRDDGRDRGRRRGADDPARAAPHQLHAHPPPGLLRPRRELRRPVGGWPRATTTTRAGRRP